LNPAKLIILGLLVEFIIYFFIKIYFFISKPVYYTGVYSAAVGAPPLVMPAHRGRGGFKRSSLSR